VAVTDKVVIGESVAGMLIWPLGVKRRLTDQYGTHSYPAWPSIQLDQQGLVEPAPNPPESA